MGQLSFNWKSFWDLSSPARAAEAFVELYGSDAALAAAHCGLEAHGDERHDDYRFWVAVFARLRAAEQSPVTKTPVPRRRYDNSPELITPSKAVH